MMLVDGLHGLLAEHNDRALAAAPLFRHRMEGRVPHPFDQEFFEARTAFPYFGYVLARNDGCPDFWMVNHDDDLVAQHYFWYGRNGYEPLSTQAWVQRARARTGAVLDVGAFSGVFGLLAYFANPANDVHLFEPTARAYGRAVDNLRANFASLAVTAHHVALSNGPRRVEFKHFRGAQELGSGASYVDKVGEEVHEVEVCAATTLDEVCVDLPAPPTLVKIDVEEAEVDVLHGGERLVAAGTAAFLVEVVPSTCAEVRAIMHRYRCTALDEQARACIDVGTADGLLEDVVGRSGFVNLLFEPPDRRRDG